MSTLLLASMLSPTTLVLGGLDPVDLVTGTEVLGRPALSRDYLRHEYRFCSEAHQAAFNADVARFAVQNGGACGQMGPLTGRGTPNRWAVAEGKIFLFASEGCRNSFLKDPEAFISKASPTHTVAAGEASKAKSLYQKMLEAHGGGKIAGASQVVWEQMTPYKQAGVDKIWHSLNAYLGSNKIARWEEWDSGRAFFVVDGEIAKEGKPDEVFDLHPQEKRALVAGMARHPVGILKSGLKPVSLTDGASGLQFTDDSGTFRVYLDSGTSRIKSVEFKDLFGGRIEDVVIEYSEYAQVDGVWLPQSSRTKRGQGDWAKPVWVKYTVGGQLPKVFADARGGVIQA